jgi:hypothetical protein
MFATSYSFSSSRHRFQFALRSLFAGILIWDGKGDMWDMLFFRILCVWPARRRRFGGRAG